MKSEFLLAFNEIAELRKLPKEVVMEALSAALVSAYRRDTDIPATYEVEVRFDEKTGAPAIWAQKMVVEEVEEPTAEVTLKKARIFEDDAEVGELVYVEDTPEGFGRIAAQTAKQVILQRMREAERDAQYQEYLERVGDLVTGTVQNRNEDVVTVSLGRSEAILPRSQQMPNEIYDPHSKVRAYVMEVRKNNRGPQIVISRTHRNMLRRLLEYEVPEIYNGTVEIKSIAREPGARSKVAVYSNQPGADPVGACVGMRGIRIQTIVKELNDEKIDVIEWSPEQEAFIAKALSPARVTMVFLDDDPDAGRTATVVVPDDQLSLAIGREGQNARLAAKLTGWRIDIKSIAEMAIEAADNLESEDELEELRTENEEFIERALLVVDKKRNNRPVMPEEYNDLIEFVKLVEGYRLSLREEGRVGRRTEIQEAKDRIPEIAYEVPLDRTDIALSAYRFLNDHGFRNAGEVMEKYFIDPQDFEKLRGYKPGLMKSIGKFAENFDAEEFLQAEEEAAEEIEDAAPEPDVVEEADDVVDEPEPEVVAEAPVEEEEEERDPDFMHKEELARQRRAAIVEKLASKGIGVDIEEESEAAEDTDDDDDVDYDEYDDYEDYDDDDFDDDDFDDDDFDDEDYDEADAEERRRAKQRRRQLIYDEELGRVVSKRRRKKGRAREKWQDFTIDDLDEE